MGKSAVVFLPGSQWPSCVALSQSCQRPWGPHPTFIRSLEHRMEGRINEVERGEDYRKDTSCLLHPDLSDVMMSMATDIIGLLIHETQFSVANW